MSTLHTFGCSITQGFALPDTIRPALDDEGRPLTVEEIEQRGIHWSEIHVYRPSKWAWPQVLADQLGMVSVNHARRGACFQQIARQCAVGAKDIRPEDTVIVMWTYFSRLSLQWPARSSVPLGTIANANWGWKTVFTGFNHLFGLMPAKNCTSEEETRIQKFIESAVKNTYLDPRDTYNRYYNNLVLQEMTAGYLRATAARIIHLSVELEPVLEQLETARQQLDPSLKEPINISPPDDWYTVSVDYDSGHALLNPNIPLADNGTHPSVKHHSNFADLIKRRYFQ